jgi:ElaB/YqjD/DUF883 family membrane-anchored ribosome-binding protein
MDRSTTLGGNAQLGDPNPLSNPAVSPKIEGAAQTAHQTVDKVSEKTNSQVDRLSGMAHRAVDSAADSASTAAQWASAIPEQAKQVQTKISEAACTSIRARPLVSVAGAIAVGYLLGRLGRR